MKPPSGKCDIFPDKMGFVKECKIYDAFSRSHPKINLDALSRLWDTFP